VREGVVFCFRVCSAMLPGASLLSFPRRLGTEAFEELDRAVALIDQPSHVVRCSA
jgi:hypothetical protein